MRASFSKLVYVRSATELGVDTASFCCWVSHKRRRRSSLATIARKPSHSSSMARHLLSSSTLFICEFLDAMESSSLSDLFSASMTAKLASLLVIFVSGACTSLELATSLKVFSLASWSDDSWLIFADEVAATAWDSVVKVFTAAAGTNLPKERAGANDKGGVGGDGGGVLTPETPSFEPQ